MLFRRRKTTGQKGEALARKFLRKKGWKIVTKNLRVGHDEVDIIALSPKGKTLALVEVRSTQNPNQDPRQTIGHRKRRCMARAARKLRALAHCHNTRLRVDLVTVNFGFIPPEISLYEEQLPISKM